MELSRIGKPISLEQLESTTKIGLLLVTFAMKVGDVQKRVAMVRETLEIAERMVRPNGRPFFDRIDVVIPSDPYCAEHDCGETEAALKEALSTHERAFFQNVTGDPFTFAKNIGFAIQLRHGIDYTMTMSPEARNYMMQPNMDLVSKAICDGALCVGGAINELRESVLEGRVAGTFAVWHTLAALSMGGFDVEAARGSNPETSRFLLKFDDSGKPVVGVRLDGVEEVVLLARMFQHYGPCIAPVVLIESDGIRYQAPDPVTQPELYKRHLQKMASKELRQNTHLSRAGFEPDLSSGVMAGYRQNQK